MTTWIDAVLATFTEAIGSFPIQASDAQMAFWASFEIALSQPQSKEQLLAEENEGLRQSVFSTYAADSERNAK